MQYHIVQPYNGYGQPLNNKVLDCLQKVFCCCKITLGPTSRLQHNTCSVSGIPVQSWNISHKAQTWRRSDFHLFPALNDHLSGHKWAGDDDMETAAEVTKTHGTDFYEAVINKLVPRVDKCLDLGGGEDFEK